MQISVYRSQNGGRICVFLPHWMPFCELYTLICMGLPAMVLILESGQFIMKCYKTIFIIGIRQISLMGPRELGNKIPHLHNFHFLLACFATLGKIFCFFLYFVEFSLISLASSQLDTKVEVTMIVMNVHIKYIFESV